MVTGVMRAMRPAQWVKNLFVAGPLLFAQRVDHAGDVLGVTVVGLCWCALASGVYLMNDVADRERDRSHPDKKSRPIASGEVSVGVALGISAGLIGSAIAIAALLDPSVGGVLAGYFGVNLAYSAFLKRMVLVDVMSVASGFVLRVVSGAWIISVAPSAWLLVCTGLLALFLGFAKRRQELASGGDSRGSRDVLTEYTIPFLDAVEGVLATATIIAYTIYTMAPETVARIGDNRLLLTAPIVLHGLLRYLYLVHVKGMGENPTRVALTDPGMVITVGFWLLISGTLLYV